MSRRRGSVVDVEMRRPGHGIEQMQVVGQSAAGEQTLGERGQRIDRVVDAAQQHGLVQQGRQRRHAAPATRARPLRRARWRGWRARRAPCRGACRAARAAGRRRRVREWRSGNACGSGRVVMAVSSSRAMSSPRRRLERLKGSPPLKIASRASGTLRSSASAARPVGARGELRRVRELAAKAVAAMQRAGAARDQQHAARIFLDEPGCRKPPARGRDRP